jgi:hypothetical protein
MRKDAIQGEVFPVLEQGDYGKDMDGLWWARVPAPGFSTASLGDHSVIEHEDGTITVSPSILMMRRDGKSWHGYLEKGIWREC